MGRVERWPSPGATLEPFDAREYVEAAALDLEPFPACMANDPSPAPPATWSTATNSITPLKFLSVFSGNPSYLAFKNHQIVV